MTEFDYGETAIPTADAVIASLPPDDSPTVIDSPYEYACQHPGCGAELHYGGRGRKPIYCVAHKPYHRQSRGAATTRASKSDWQTPLTDALMANFVGIGMVVYPFEHFDGQTIINGSPKLAQSLVVVAETNPSVRRGLEKFVESAGWAMVAASVGAIAIPIMQHHNMLPAMKLPFPTAAPQTAGV